MSRAVTVGPSVADLPQRFDRLLVVDVDEVVLHFIAPFCDLLAEHGARMHFESFRLTGNVRSISTGAALTGHELDGVTEQLYAEQEVRQQPVPFAAEALSCLAETMDVVFLTAMTPSHYEPRRRLLDRSDLPFPMIATSRGKGALVQHMRERWRGPIVFVDDLPPNLEGVRRSVPDVHLVHLMANRELLPHLPPMPSGTLRPADWRSAVGMIENLR